MNTRREFLQQSGAVAGTTLVAGAALAQVVQQSAVGSKDWYDRPMRWMQLAFVEDDPGQYDPKFWLDYFGRCHADAACISAGGCMAFYPTKIPLHYRSRFLAGHDPFGEMVKGCRGLGMNVIARTDPHALPWTHIRSGLRCRPMARRGGTGPIPRYGFRARWAVITSAS